MKQSKFTKTISYDGKNGVKTAEIIVTMNYDDRIKTGTNAITHDDYSVKVSIHKVEAFVEGKMIVHRIELQTEEAVLAATEEVLQIAEDHIRDLANNDPVETFETKMNKLFFKYDE